MTEQTIAVCQVVIRNSLIEKVWDDPRSKEHFRKFPQDHLRIPFDDPDPQVQCFQRFSNKNSSIEH